MKTKSKSFFLLGEISADSTSALFESLLTDSAAKGATLYINSLGGDSETAMGLYDLVKQNGMNTHVVGAAESSAALVFLAGKKRTMSEHSHLLFHDGSYTPDKPKTSAELYHLSVQLGRFDSIEFRLLSPLLHRVGFQVPAIQNTHIDIKFARELGLTN